MRLHSIFSRITLVTSCCAALPGLLLGCAAKPEPQPVAPAQPAPQPAQPVAAAEPAAPAQPSEEEKKKAEEQQRLADDFAKMEADHKAELERITPDIRKAAEKLSQETYWTVRAGVSAALQSPHRRPGNAARDAQRHPVETLDAFGLKPSDTVLEYGPGAGWVTELIAPLLAKKGKLYVTQTDPSGPMDQRSTLYGKRTQYFLQALPEAYGKVEPVIVDSSAPKLPFDAQLDVVLLMRGLHGMYNSKTLDAWLAEFHRALKPNGILAIEEHRANADANPDESSPKGYLPEPFVIERISAAGFKLAKKSEVNANPKDNHDHPFGVWSLPPTLRGGDTDRAKYEEIGESDRMTLRFVKIAK
jgi:predicted methyltransferase